MAYQNSVYRSGTEPHRGEASEIPEPPAPAAAPASHRSVHPYASRRHMSDSVVSVHRSRPVSAAQHQKYKAELRVLPEDNVAQQVSDQHKCNL